MNIYLLRHGRQNSTKCNVNVSLDEIGREQAYLVGKRLAKYHIDGIYSSDLIRAIETADIIKQIIEENRKGSIPQEVRTGLREIEFGELEGIENKEIPFLYKEFIEQRDRLQEDLPYPGGECGQQVFERAYPVLLEMAESGYKNVAVVTHGGTIRSLIAGIMGADQSQKLLLGKQLENCSITQLNYVREQERFYIERFNDYAHLEEEERLLRRSW